MDITKHKQRNRIMKRTTRTIAALTALIPLLLSTAVMESHAQRHDPVTTEPTPRKGEPCDDKTESNVSKTPWKLSGLGFLTMQNTPVDTTRIQGAANQLSNAVGGNLGNYQAIVDTIKGWMTGATFVGYYQFSRTVTTTIKEWKCVNGVLKLVRNETRTFDEKTPWIQIGPFSSSDITVKKLQAIIEKARAELPAE